MTDKPEQTGFGNLQPVDETPSADVLKIRKLNDDLRQQHRGGAIVITPGVAQLGPAAVGRILQAVAQFDDFSADNDPYGEHDCAVMSVGSLRIIWKVDYLDPTLRYHSSDATSPRATRRVMTVMLSSEY